MSARSTSFPSDPVAHLGGLIHLGFLALPPAEEFGSFSALHVSNM